MQGDRDRADALSREIIGASIEVHRALGPGLLESAYEACLCHELGLRGISYERQVALPVIYKGTRLDCGYRLDILVEKLVILEIKAVAEFLPIHQAQLMTYLRLRGLWLGLLLNFHVTKMTLGIKRLVN